MVSTLICIDKKDPKKPLSKFIKWIGARQKEAKKRSLHSTVLAHPCASRYSNILSIINEHFELLFNAANAALGTCSAVSWAPVRTTGNLLPEGSGREANDCRICLHSLPPVFLIGVKMKEDFTPGVYSCQYIN